jgi:hypothetical protein
MRADVIRSEGWPMENIFDAEDLMNRIKQGEFDGRLNEQLISLSLDQLENVALLMSNKINE